MSAMASRLRFGNMRQRMSLRFKSTALFASLNKIIIMNSIIVIYSYCFGSIVLERFIRRGRALPFGFNSHPTVRTPEKSLTLETKED